MTEQYATYCPEDNKLRLYVGRVPRHEYEKLRAQGWTSTPKQDCDFVTTWTPERYATACEYSEGIVLDEDQSPADRAADRAERFAGYRENRIADALGHADRYEAGPMAHGFQSQARAERAAARHDRIAGRACDAWSKAEYWQQRTAGVISHALYVSSPDVRMGRIKTLEAEQRKQLQSLEDYRKIFRAWKKVAEMENPERQNKVALHLANVAGGHYEYKHPRPEKATEYMWTHGTSLYSLLTFEPDPITGAEAAALWLEGKQDPDSEEFAESRVMQWARHYELRLGYENMMLDAQGGRAAHVEMEVGGWLGGRQIYKVNKSNATGRVVSVHVKGPKVSGWTYKAKNVPGTDYALYQIDTERLAPGAYRPPTDEERAAFAAEMDGQKKQKAAKAKAKRDAGENCPLVNPTEEDAQRLVDAWNAQKQAEHEAKNIYSSHEARARHSAEFVPAKVVCITQAQYAAASKGAYARAETRGLCANMKLEPRVSNLYSSAAKKAAEERGPAVCKVRVTSGGKANGWSFETIIVLTDKPLKPLPASVWAPREKPQEAPTAPAGPLKQAEMFAAA